MRKSGIPAPNFHSIRTPIQFALHCLFLLGVVACQQGAAMTDVMDGLAMEESGEVIVTRFAGQVSGVSDSEGEPLTILDVSYSGVPGQLDPQTAVSVPDITLIENLFVGLTRYDHASDTIEPELAREWTVSSDGRTWTFYLRDDVHWIRSPIEQNSFALGRSEPEILRPVVAGDMAAAVHRLCSEIESPEVFVFFLIEGCEAARALGDSDAEEIAVSGVRTLDDTTLEIRLTEPAGYFLTITSLQIFRPIPADIVAEDAGGDESWVTMQNAVTSGPFVLAQGTTEDVLTILQRNPFWPIPFKGNVDQVNVWWLPVDTANELWLAKDLDISTATADMREAMQSSANFRTRVHLVSNQGSFYLAFNFDSPVFREESVRRAFAAAIDRETLITDVFAEQGEPQRHFSPPGVIGAPPAEVVGTGYNPDLARIEMSNSSFRDCRFMPEIRYLVGTNDLDLFLAETIRSMWVRELNCLDEQIIIEQAQFGTLLAETRRESGESRPDIWNLGWASFFPDAHNWLTDVLHCRESENRMNRPCSAVDEMLLLAAGSHSLDERREIYRSAENLFFGEGGIAPIAPLLVQGDHVLVQSWVQYAPAHFGGEQFDTYQVAADVKELERGQ